MTTFIRHHAGALIAATTALMLAVIGGAIAYGEMGQRVTSAEKRIELHDSALSRIGEDLAEIKGFVKAIWEESKGSD